MILFFSSLFAADKTPNGFPVITQSPQTRVIEIGHTAVMQCRSTGNPTPKIYWLKDGKRLEMSNQRYTLIDGKYYMVFHNSQCNFIRLSVNTKIHLIKLHFFSALFVESRIWILIKSNVGFICDMIRINFSLFFRSHNK